ncbi:MAG: histidinol dehydrogenase [Niabella sp.]
MKVYKYPARKNWTQLCTRPEHDSTVFLPRVQSIIDDVKNNGDNALLAYNKKFDGVETKQLAVTAAEIKQAAARISDELKAALLQAKENIETFHSSQINNEPAVAIDNGITCWREARPIEKVGLYIPGGSAPLFSTVLMLGIPAMIAGCREVILCTPPNKEGKVNPAILYAASLCNISKIYKTGGAQAIAAMAYGTESIPKVFKIFGPGNQYVTMAKQLVQNASAIDMPAGPSEVLVIADETANPDFVAADLLAQAEHGPDSQVILVCTQTIMAKAVQQSIAKQLSDLPRKAIAEKALRTSAIILLRHLDEAIDFSNIYAPEHLILACKAKSILSKITSAGSVFVGNYSPESAGDYASGTNHTLPTNGYAAMYSGVSIDSFCKKITFQQLNKSGLKSLAGTITTMAEAEGLQAHSNAVKLRIKNINHK